MPRFVTEGPDTTPRIGPPASWLAEFPPRRWHLALAAGLVVAVHLGGVSAQWWPTPDSALYLGLGDSLAAGKGYQFNGEVCNRVTPGLPMILAAVRRVFGPGYWAGNFLMGLCGVGLLWLAYRLIGRLSDRRTALAAVLCTAFSYTFYFGCHRILTDAPFSLLFWGVLCTALLAGRRSLRWLPAVVALVAAAIAVRMPGALLLVPLAVGMAFDRLEGVPRKRWLVLAGAVLAATAATMVLFHLLGSNAAPHAPIYEQSLRRVGAYSLLRKASRLGGGLLMLPSVLAEMFTSQDGLRAVGWVALAWSAIGGVVLWRRGQRMPAIAIPLYVAGLAIVGNPDSVRSRYLLPVQPLVAYMMIEGLLWTVRAVCRLRRKIPAPMLYLKAATVFTAVLVAANAPRLLRNAAWYTYLSYTPRYYHVIRHGVHVERFKLARWLAGACRPDERIGMAGHQVWLLHYLTGRRIVPLAGGLLWRTPDAERVVRNAEEAADVRFVVVGKEEGWPEFRRAIRRLLETSGSLERIYEGGDWRVYRRRPRPDRPRTSSAPRPPA